MFCSPNTQLLIFLGFINALSLLSPLLFLKDKLSCGRQLLRACGSIWVAILKWGTEVILVTELCEDQILAHLGFWAAIQYSYTNYLTFLPHFPCFVTPLTSGQAFLRYLLMEIYYVKQSKSRRYLWSRSTQKYPFVNLTVFSMAFFQVCFLDESNS